MAADGHLEYAKMAITSQPVCRSMSRLVIRWGFRLSLNVFAIGLHTRTAVARLPLRQLGFLAIFTITSANLIEF